MLKIGLIGLGKLGVEILKQIKIMEQSEGNKRLREQLQINSIISSIYSQRTDYENTTQDFNEFLSKVDVIIDCSAYGFDQRIQRINKPIVIATTQQITHYPARAILMPNGSLSWHLAQEMMLNLAKSTSYQFVITDIHHKDKKDAPSGTARRLISQLEAVGAKVECTSARAFNCIGNHIIYAFNDSEMIKIDHQILDRSVFAKGLIAAANWIAIQPDGLYQAHDMFK